MTISGAGTVMNIDFPLQPGGIITGRVTDQGTGLPLANLNVNINFFSIGGWGSGACTDDNGYYVFRALPYDDYTVDASGGWNHCLNEPGLYAQEYYQVPTANDR